MKKYLILMILLYIARPCLAGVGFDAVGPSSSGTGTTSTSLSWSHTCTGSNLLLIVAVLVGDSPDTETVIVTYNSVSMTSAGKVHSNNQTAGFVEMFYLARPAGGSHTVQVNTSGGLPYSVVGGSVSFTGVDQSTPVRNVTTNISSGTSISVNVSSAVGNMAVDAVANGSEVTSSTQTQRWLNNYTPSSAAGNGAQSTAAGAASVTMGYNITADWGAIIALDVVAAGSTGMQIPMTLPSSMLSAANRVVVP